MITYNHGPYIAQAIESVLMQKTDFPIELCIGEDRSTDGTREICIKYAKKYPQIIRLILRSTNDKEQSRFYPTGRLNGYLTRQSCRGEFIATLEGDDFWLDPHKLKKQVDYLKAHADCNICATHALQWMVDGTIGSTINPSEGLSSFTIDNLLSGNGGIVNTCTLVYRRKRFSDPFLWSSNIIGGDWALLASALNDGSYCGVLPGLSAVYRIHNKGAWRGVLKSKRERISIVLSYLRAYEAIAHALIREKLLNHISYYEISQTYYSKQGLAKAIVLTQAIRSKPAVRTALLKATWRKLQNALKRNRRR